MPLRALAEAEPGLGGELPANLGPFAGRDPARLRELLQDAGFAEARVESLTEPVWLGDTAEAATELLSTSRPGQLLVSALDSAT